MPDEKRLPAAPPDPFAASDDDVKAFIGSAPAPDKEKAKADVEARIASIDAEMVERRATLAQIPESKADVRKGLTDYIKHLLGEKNRLTARLKEIG